MTIFAVRFLHRLKQNSQLNFAMSGTCHLLLMVYNAEKRAMLIAGYNFEADLDYAQIPNVSMLYKQ